MGYLHIGNLYKAQEILLFKECYALEKVHGTSAHIKWADGKLCFFAGGGNHKCFCALFPDTLVDRFRELNLPDVIVFGESFGGKCQGMRDTYGSDLRFIVFEVKVGENWLSVPDAEDVSRTLNLPFVPYQRIPATVEAIDAELAKDSLIAIEPGHKREGIVLRPPLELRKNNGERIIAKHKNEEFRETKSKRTITDVAKLAVLEGTRSIAEEWVTPMRLSHVLDKFPDAGIEQTGDVIRTMIEDVQREGIGEIAWSKDVQRAIGQRTAMLMKQRMKQLLEVVS